MRRFIHLPAAVLATAMLASPVQAALLVDYNFNEGSGASVANSGTLGSAANGTLTGTWSANTPSGTGSSVKFTGTNANEGVTTGSVVAGLNGLNQITGLLWLNLTAAPAAGDRLISNQSTLTNGFDFSIFSASSGNFTVALNTDAVTGSASNSISQNLNSWMFLAFTYDGTQTTNNVQFYIGTTTGGVAALGSAKSQNAGALGTSVNPFEVANTAQSTSDRTPAALFDNVQIYDTVLSLSELEAVRVATSAIPEPATWGLLTLAGTLVLLRRRRNAAAAR